MVIVRYYPPFWYVFRSVTGIGDSVENKAKLAALLARGDTVQADVELGTVSGVGIFGVWVSHPVGVGLAVVGAPEAPLKAFLLCGSKNNKRMY